MAAGAGAPPPPGAQAPAFVSFSARLRAADDVKISRASAASVAAVAATRDSASFSEMVREYDRRVTESELIEAGVPPGAERLPGWAAMRDLASAVCALNLQLTV